MNNLKNKKIKLIIYFIFLLYLLLPNNKLLSNNNDENKYNWDQISGKWKLYHSDNFHYLYTSKSRAYNFGSSELINNCSIISINKFKNISKIKTKVSVINPQKGSNFMLFWNAKSYRTFYAFRLHGDNKNFNKIVFLSSTIIDTTKSPRIDWNFEIKELSSKNINIDYSNVYNITILFFNRKRVRLLINNKEIITAKIANKFSSGRIGFSHENNLIRIYNAELYSGNKIIFKDYFKKDKIKRLRIKAEKLKK